jgi:hypothetical protein
MPNHFSPLMLSTQRLPENRSVPAKNSHLPIVTNLEGHLLCHQAAAISAKA